MKKIKEMSKKEMSDVLGGRRRQVEWYDVNGDGRIDKVVSIYDNANNLIRVRIHFR